jgi:hypothetical protein
LWAHKYPDEVHTIVGLDMALPHHYERMNLGFCQNVFKVSTWIMRSIGIQCFPLFHILGGINDKKNLSKKEWTQEKRKIGL